jgi:hypothetical protein
MRVASARTGSLPDGALAPVTIDEVLFIFSQTASPNGARGIDGHGISWIAARLRPTVATKADRLHLVTLASLTLPAAITQIQAYLANQRVRAPPRWSSAYTIGGVPESGLGAPARPRDDTRGLAVLDWHTSRREFLTKEAAAAREATHRGRGSSLRNPR